MVCSIYYDTLFKMILQYVVNYTKLIFLLFLRTQDFLLISVQLQFITTILVFLIFLRDNSISFSYEHNIMCQINFDFLSTRSHVCVWRDSLETYYIYNIKKLGVINYNSLIQFGF